MADDRVVIVHRTDVHIADRPPVSRKDDYASAILHKLALVGDIARKVGADAVIDTGDFFHIQAPNRTSHSLVQRVMEVHETRYTCPVYSVVGNHDLSGANLDSLGRQPIGTLFRSRTFRQLGEVVLGGDGRPRVRIVGVPYSTKPTLESLTVERGDEDVLVEACHIYSAPGGNVPFRDLGDEPVFAWEDLATLPADVWLGGHYHKDQGVALVGGKHFVFPGSLSRGVFSWDEMDRLPRVAIVTFDYEPEDFSGPGPFLGPPRVRTKAVLVRLAGLPVAEEIYDVRARTVDRDVSERISGFVASLTGATSKADPLQEILGRSDASPEVRERAADYLRQAMGEGR